MNGFNNSHDHDRFEGPRGPRHHHDDHTPDGDGDYQGPGDDRRGGFGGFGPGMGGPRGGRGRGRGGFGPGFGPGFKGGFGGFGPGFGPGMGGPGFKGGFGRSGRARKGDVRSAILSLLSQHSYHGYGIIGAIARHTDGAWRPSPGSVYPALAALQAEGLISTTDDGNRTEFELTDAGKAYVAEHPEEMAQVWAEVSEEAGANADLRLSIGKLMGAVHQIGMGGTEEQVKATTDALDAARRTIYKLLSD